MELGLRGKSVIVTGAGSNIGRAIALAFAREGAQVAVVDIDREAGERTAWLAESQGAASAAFVPCDVTDRDQVAAMAEEVTRRLGRIDVLVNNVGWDRLRLFLEEPWEEIDRKVRLNLWSVLICSRIILPRLVEQRSGAVVNIASDAGRMGEYREAVYSACKGGVIALTKALAR
ncbi:MAG: SDR family oxidoreductase, partial [Dehalococcoidia bacterium]|nr:SDR family oxidoreductase [Dehalococcoidia bacterium]